MFGPWNMLLSRGGRARDALPTMRCGQGCASPATSPACSGVPSTAQQVVGKGGAATPPPFSIPLFPRSQLDLSLSHVWPSSLPQALQCGAPLWYREEGPRPPSPIPPCPPRPRAHRPWTGAAVQRARLGPSPAHGRRRWWCIPAMAFVCSCALQGALPAAAAVAALRLRGAALWQRRSFLAGGAGAGRLCLRLRGRRQTTLVHLAVVVRAERKVLRGCRVVQPRGAASTAAGAGPRWRCPAHAQGEQRPRLRQRLRQRVLAQTLFRRTVALQRCGGRGVSAASRMRQSDRPGRRYHQAAPRGLNPPAVGVLGARTPLTSIV